MEANKTNLEPKEGISELIDRRETVMYFAQNELYAEKSNKKTMYKLLVGD